MKNAKKLLAIAIALVMLVSTLVSGLVVSAADANTLVIGTTEIVKGTATADVQFVLTFAEATKAPHSLCTITAAEGLTLSELKIDAVDYVSIGDTPVEDDELIDADAEVTINNDGKNIAAGKVLFESAVDSKAPTVNSITFTATFDVAADAAVGDYAVNAEIDATNYDEADYTIAVTAGKITIAAPHECVAGEAIDNGDGTHDVPCTGCDVLIKDDEPHNFVDGACDVCGAAEPVTGPVENEELAKAAYSLKMKISNTLGFQYGFFFNGVNVEYDDIELEVRKPLLSTDKDTQYCFTGEEAVKVFTSADVASGSYPAYGLYYFEYTDVAMYEMSLDVTYTLYTIVDGERAEYYTFAPKSLAAQANDYYTENINDETKRSFAVDLLNLGTTAQTHFAAIGATDNALKTFAAPNANVNQEFATPYEVVDAVEGTRDTQITTQLQLLSSPSFWYTINLSAAGKTNPSDLTFTATYDTIATGTPVAVTRQVNGSELTAAEGAYGAYGLYYFGFDQVALYDANKVITLTIEDTAGNTWTHQYSVESFLSANIDATGTAGDVYRAVASFGASCRNFWPNY